MYYYKATHAFDAYLCNRRKRLSILTMRNTVKKRKQMLTLLPFTAYVTSRQLCVTRIFLCKLIVIENVLHLAHNQATMTPTIWRWRRSDAKRRRHGGGDEVKVSRALFRKPRSCSGSQWCFACLASALRMGIIYKKKK